MLKPRNYVKSSVHPTAHCWTARSEIYLGCEEGYVLAIDAETCSVSVLQQNLLPGKKYCIVCFIQVEKEVDK